MTHHHRLKCHPAPFNALRSGMKTCEFRFNDRNFKVGDILDIFEWLEESREFTRCIQTRTITHIQRDFGIPDGYVMLSLGEFK